MKISCLPVSWYSEILAGKIPLRDWLSFAAALRLDAVDLTILFLQDKSSEELQSLRQLILDSGLELCMVTCYPDLASIPDAIDVVDIFRRSEEMASIVEDAIKIGAKAVWMQEGVTSKSDAAQAGRAGLLVVMDKCMLKEHRRLKDSSNKK